jgi:glycosyltransferase involved in cell wall biosynthesis
MRILYVITKAEMGGGQVHVLDLLRGFRGRHELHLATGEEEFLTAEARKLGVHCHIVPELIHETRPVTDARAVRQVAELLGRIRPHLVHSHTTKAGLVGRAAAFLRRVPSVFTAHSWAFSDGVSMAWKLMGVPTEWVAARVSDRIINVSGANRDLALRYGLGPARRLVTIHNGIPDTPHVAAPGLGEETEIVMVARFAPQKHHELILEAFAGLVLPSKLTFIGDGPRLGAMKELAGRLGIERRVRFLGERKDVPEILAGAHVFALASHWEGFPLSILEGMRAGLPVVTTAAGGSGEALKHGTTGYVVEKGDTAGFGQALENLCRNAALRERMGRAGRERFLNHFSLDQMLRKTSALYEEVWRERGIHYSPQPQVETVGTH